MRVPRICLGKQKRRGCLDVLPNPIERTFLIRCVGVDAWFNIVTPGDAAGGYSWGSSDRALDGQPLLGGKRLARVPPACLSGGMIGGSGVVRRAGDDAPGTLLAKRS